MSKFKGQLFPRFNRACEATGAAKRYRIPKENVRMLGQGKSVVFDLMVYQTSTTGRVTFYVFDGCFGALLPGDGGYLVSMSGTTAFTAAGRYTFSTNQTLKADVEIVADVDDTGAAGVESVEFELWATVYTD